MIDVSLAYVRTVLDQYLCNQYRSDSVVVLNHLVGPDGMTPQDNANKVVISLVNLEYETSRQFSNEVRAGMSSASLVNAPVWFNLHILVSASFDNYSEALKFLTASIGFFQANTVFNRSNHPLLPDGVNTLKFEIENSPANKMENIWMALGAKYLPSIIYKVRQVCVQTDQVTAVLPLVQQTSGAVGVQ